MQNTEDNLIMILSFTIHRDTQEYIVNPLILQTFVLTPTKHNHAQSICVHISWEIVFIFDNYTGTASCNSITVK